MKERRKLLFCFTFTCYFTDRSALTLSAEQLGRTYGTVYVKANTLNTEVERKQWREREK